MAPGDSLNNDRIDLLKSFAAIYDRGETIFKDREKDNEVFYRYRKSE